MKDKAEVDFKLEKRQKRVLGPFFGSIMELCFIVKEIQTLNLPNVKKGPPHLTRVSYKNLKVPRRI
jgi:hypothetical protein